MALVIQLILNFWMGYHLDDHSFSTFKKSGLFLMPLLVPVVAVIRLAIAFTIAGNPDFSALSFNTHYFVGQVLLLAFAIVLQLLFHLSIFGALRRARNAAH